MVDKGMYFSNEKELQLYMAAVMVSKGVQVELEVTTHNGRRIDLVTNRYAIECKSTLTRSSLLQAAAQMKLYARSFPNHEYVLAGMSPRDLKGYKAAHSTAVDIKREFGYTVWFIDRMSYFTDIKKDEENLEKREKNSTNIKDNPQEKGCEITESRNYKKIFSQILRYGLALYLTYAVLEGIYNRIKNDDRDYWGTAFGIGIVYVVLAYPFRSSKKEGN